MSLQNISIKNTKKVALIKKTLAAVVLVGFAWLIFSAVSTNVETENLEPQIIKAPKVVKVRPTSPGGMQIDHQDKKVFDLLESSTSAGESDFVVMESQNTEKRLESLSKKAVAKAKVTKVEIEKEEVSKPIAVKKVTLRKAEPEVIKTPKKVVIKKVEKVEKIKKIESKKQKVVSKAKGWALQLGSFRKVTDAERAVTIYTKKVGAELKGFAPYIKKASLGDKGTVYRVYFTGFSDKNQAKQVCDKLQAKKQACFRTVLK